MAISQDLIDKIKNEADIVNIIGSYINLEKRSSSYWGICPFHPDTNPSLSVNPEKRIWKCFTCGVGGNVFTFVSRYLKVSFTEAVGIVAEKSGITITDSKEDEKTRLFRRYHNILSDAKDFYNFYLENTVDGSMAKEYLKTRELTEDIVKRFGIGLSPNSFDGLFKALTNNDTYLPAELAEVGLAKYQKESNNYYDVFRHRIMFPIEDNYGHVVGFSARLYEKSDNEPKYMNSNDNVVFKKGNILYNYYKAQNQIKMHDTVYLFEGFMDVIAAYKVGIENAVATMGTALTKNHITFLEKIAKKIVICYDGDNAGISATKKTIIALQNSSMEVKAVLIPGNLDPDEYLKEKGKESFELLLSSPINPIDYLYNIELKNLIKEDLSSCESFKKNIFKLMNYFKSETLNEAMIKRIANELNVSSKSIYSDFVNNQNITYFDAFSSDVVDFKEKTEDKKIKRREKRKYNYAEDQLIIYAYQSKENSDYVVSLLSLGQCVDKEKRDLLLKITDYYRDNELMNDEKLQKSLSEKEKYTLEQLLLNIVPTKDEVEELAKAVSEFPIAKKTEDVYLETKETKDLNKIQEFINIRQKIVKIKK